MIYKFMIPAGEFREITSTLSMAGALAVVRAPDVEAAKTTLRAFCDIIGRPYWGDVADIVPYESEGSGSVLGYAEA